MCKHGVMCNKGVDNYPDVLEFGLECYKTQKNNLYSCWYSSFYNPICSCMG